MEYLIVGETTQPYKLSEQEQKEIRKAFFPVKTINNNNKVVDLNINKQQAIERIKKRNEALVLLGYEPKKYRIVSHNKMSEHDPRKNQY